MKQSSQFALLIIWFLLSGCKSHLLNQKDDLDAALALDAFVTDLQSNRIDKMMIFSVGCNGCLVQSEIARDYVLWIENDHGYVHSMSNSLTIETLGTNSIFSFYEENQSELVKGVQSSGIFLDHHHFSELKVLFPQDSFSVSIAHYDLNSGKSYELVHFLHRIRSLLLDFEIKSDVIKSLKKYRGKVR